MGWEEAIPEKLKTWYSISVFLSVPKQNEISELFFFWDTSLAHTFMGSLFVEPPLVDEDPCKTAVKGIVLHYVIYAAELLMEWT